jgi:hypothetical protein
LAMPLSHRKHCLAGYDIQPAKNSPKRTRDLLPSTLNMEAGLPSYIKKIYLTRRTNLLQIFSNLPHMLSLYPSILFPICAVHQPFVFQLYLRPTNRRFIQYYCLTHKTVLLSPIHNIYSLHHTLTTCCVLRLFSVPAPPQNP